MIKFEQVPDEVVDAAVAMRDRGGGMRDIIRTAINAWPGVFTRPAVPDGVWHSYDCSRARIILPLPQEASDD
jgi:hypothetical protein